MQQRISTFCRLLTGVDAACVISPANLFYLTGWQVSAMERFLALIIGDGVPPTLIVPRLEYENARRLTTGVELVGWQDGEDPVSTAANLVAKSGRPPRLGIEKRVMTVASAEALLSAVPDADLVDIAGIFAEMRQVKEPGELSALSRAADIADEAARTGLSGLTHGRRECEVAGDIEGIIRSRGDRKASFPPLVQSGPNAAYPHGATGERELADGDLVVMDLGGTDSGYCSDITRTGAVGKVDSRRREVHQAVLDAQRYAVEAVRPGVRASKVDAAARDHLASVGLSQYFIHRTGHGIGIEVHEPPYIGPNDDTVLVPGMTFSVEPGVYIPGWGGVRIEDIVVVTNDGCRRLNDCVRELT